MFDKNFYPTPSEVVSLMLEPYSNLGSKLILEPSAGKGNIADYISNRVRSKSKIHTIEINQDFHSILKGKGYNVIGDDFLNFHTDYSYNLIVMNPPFDNGAKHLLKALDIMKNGHVVCLLNSETLNNPCSSERELLIDRLNELNAEIKDLGSCFKNSERPTSVNTTLVRVSIKTEEKQYFENVKFDKEAFDFPEDHDRNELMVNDVLQSYEDTYRAAIEAFKVMTQAINRFHGYVSPLRSKYDGTNFVDFAIKNEYNEFIQQLSKISWNKILEESKFSRFMTKGAKEDFNNKFKEQQSFSFTKPNMSLMLNVLWANKDEILKDCLIEVFDYMTRYFEENRIHIEGWKTNDAYKVNSKVILPNIAQYGNYHDAAYLKEYGDKFQVNYSYENELNDIDRALCFLTGDNFDKIHRIYDILKDHFNLIGTIKTGDVFENNVESEFFYIKFFKKKTIHLKFKDLKLWEQFNLIVSKLRGYPIPEKTTRKRQSNETGLMKI